MSVQFLKSTVPQESQTIRVNDCIIRGHSTVAEYLTVTGNMSTNGTLGFGPHPSDASKSGEITIPALTNYPQATSNTANVAASTGGVAPQQFMITTFESSAGVGGDIAAGASVTFTVFHSGVVAGKTMILCSKAGSYNGLVLVTDYVSSTSANQFTVTRHNHGSTTASGNQQLIFKLIQST
tara:strand:- start:71 stop:613 length:543 start_codon:yes stop_codon:yes gene_type:complete